MIHVVWSETECGRDRQEGRNCYREVLFGELDYLGLTYTKWSPDAWARKQPPGLTIVIAAIDDSGWNAICESYCTQGNSILAVGDSSGLQELLGVSSLGTVKEGWVEWGAAPLADGLRSSFHFFEAVRLKVQRDDVQTWGRLLERNGKRMDYPALATRRVGGGYAAWLALDMMKTSQLIRQGIPVVRDGPPAPDGSGAIDEGILKTDDSTVLDWEKDREALEPGGVPFYLHPIVDEWRELFMRVVHMLLRNMDLPFSQVWFWPEGMPAVGHISHDTDRNIPRQAAATLDSLQRAGVRSTWCIIMPGYDAAINERIVADGHEVALHYNALGTEIPQSGWSERDFRTQLAMLQEQFPGEEIVTNKNHYLRWEGDVQFLHWCARAGIVLEQSKGGTKQGNKGFLHGTCHPYTSIDGAGADNRVLRTISLPTLSWDPPAPLRCTAEEAYALTDRCLDVNGVVHFLFHPYMVAEENGKVSNMLAELVRYGRDRGMEWWTGKELLSWYVARQSIQVTSEKLEGKRVRLNIVSSDAVRGLTVLVALQTYTNAEADHGASVRRIRPVKRFGCSYVELLLDVQAGETAVTVTA
ncbi:hypothetical protein FE783_13910 [Paenibacillus mesophilus]|uniref:hypothetical protein n=1 Tax=Paenibacillus mesophilus TaxID=2582849 RepID=UPI00110F2075|nr:hypothetical protein [Paenibacillus mesophilus]TMV49590.1 hypothetical protein FE783_13910 [Paenibacillus mesophilus]